MDALNLELLPAEVPEGEPVQGCMAAGTGDWIGNHNEIIVAEGAE
ncbi:hypothetical protein OG462_42310 [Streptomyces sp. NBC_01077]|nr:hypothetical protein OG462_02710 [Streptomyces sp. NBC_01077]WSV43489.1 hypothetical protein OG462_42310 [Streptomyces sp. NBC_01077]